MFEEASVALHGPSADLRVTLSSGAPPAGHMPQPQPPILEDDDDGDDDDPRKPGSGDGNIDPDDDDGLGDDEDEEDDDEDTLWTRRTAAPPTDGPSPREPGVHSCGR